MLENHIDVTMDNQQPSSCLKGGEGSETSQLPYDVVECLICGESRLRLYHHLKSVHGIRKSEYLDKFPSALCESSEQLQMLRSSIADADKIFWKDPKHLVIRNQSIGVGVGAYLNTQERKDQRASVMWDGRDQFWKEFNEGKHQNYLELISTASKKYWSSLSKEEQIDLVDRRYKSSHKSLRSRKVYEYNGIEYSLASESEFYVLRQLVDSGIQFEYESVRIDKSLITGEYGYYPDFFLPDHNVLIEVKSTYTFLRNAEVNLEKMKGSLRAGYKYVLYFDNMDLDIFITLGKLTTSNLVVVGEIPSTS